MIKVVPFNLTAGSEKFKEFLAKPFTVDMLYPIFNEKSCETLFEGWRGKNMLNWYRFTNDDKYILEFYPNYFVVRKEIASFKVNDANIKYQFPLPKSINHFINIINMFSIQFYWTNWIDENFEPKDYMDKNEIEKYYNDLLTRMGKIDEIN
jgi:hypothetical protein